MIVLWILGGILLFVFLLLLPSISLHASWQEESYHLTAHYLFFRFDLTKERPKKDDTLKKKKKPKKEKEEEKKAGIGDIIPQVWETLKSSRWAFGLIRRHLIFYRLRVLASIGGPDAHQTAEAYGKTAALINGGLGLLGEIFPVHIEQIVIIPDFLSEQSHYDLSGRVRIRPIFGAAAALNLVWVFLLASIKRTSANPPPKASAPKRKRA